ncbi:dopamine beta-hydroxylase-like [Centruroides sculpturatus]|uniref:dopamine beta-hydroxylase-like n=1 Tax=Centruroides sculpturatus TaxID=218467 RepID=UPI000C6D2FA5|nr:dopamine beta-hydroxylase-like [Centruroides sculpturatus]
MALHLLFHFLLTLLISSAERPLYFDVPLDPEDRLHLYWTVDYELEIVTFELIAHVSDNEWVGMGFSNRGNITRADLCVWWVNRQGDSHFQDVWTDEGGYITVDYHNDCDLIKYKKSPHKIRIIFNRKFDTCDPQDYVIEDGTTHIVYVIGRGPIRRLDGLRLINENHNFQRVQLLKNMDPPPEFPEDTKVIPITNKKLEVPSGDTTYWCSLHLLPEEFKEKHHIVQYEATIQKGNEPLVHHIEVFHCEVEAEKELPYWNGPCSDSKKPKVLEACKKVLAAWAMGATPFAYPEEAGLPIGGANFSRYLMLEVHYNNPELKDDWVDSSGIRIYYTSQLRQYDAAVIEVGLEYTNKMAIPPHQEAFQLDGYCVSECTRVGLPPEGITIFAAQLHTHLTGIKVWTKHIRGGVELTEVNRDNHYSTHFQEIRTLKRRVQLFPGDALINSCVYETLDRDNITLGGFAISDEMCVTYMHYFPKSNLEVCKSSIDTDVLNSYFRYMNEYNNEATSPDNDVSENYQSIHWTKSNSNFLYHLYNNSPLSMQCNQSSGDRFPGYWNGVPLTEILYTLPPPEDQCNQKEIFIN